ncbi:MAG: secretion system protein [Pseudonocardiales bacterium]|nr:secretion system protein [Pseudonocardiales bacterium]
MSPLPLVLLAVATGLLSPRSPSALARRRLRPVARSLSAGHTDDMGVMADPSPTSGLRPRVLPAAGVVAIALLGFCFMGLRGVLLAGLSAPFVVYGVRTLARRVASFDNAAKADVPLLLDLIAAALRTGAPTSHAVAAVAETAPPGLRSGLKRAATLLELGAEPSEAWSVLRETSALGPIADVATRSAHSGIKLADGLGRQAVELRAELRTAGIRRANRVATMAIVPLGLCFLPAFICIGIVPIVVGVAGDAFAVVTR